MQIKTFRLARIYFFSLTSQCTNVFGLTAKKERNGDDFLSTIFSEVGKQRIDETNMTLLHEKIES